MEGKGRMGAEERKGLKDKGTRMDRKKWETVERGR